MFSQILTIARTTFIEAIRQPIYFALLMIAAVAMLLTTWSTGYSMGYSEVGEVSGDNKMLLDICLATFLVIGVLIAAFTATSTISREIENKTVLTVVSKPVARSSLILGKYLGVAAALMVAGIMMMAFVALCVRHGVLTNASQDVDQPVVIFSLTALGISLFVAVWGNFFYGWHFTQTAALLFFPLILVALVLVYLVSPKWEIQPFFRDFKPQITVACLCVLLSLLVLAAISVAASTRLGQVMTVVVCFGVFVLGLMSSYFLGTRAYQNDPLVRVQSAQPVSERFTKFDAAGDEFTISLRSGVKRKVTIGQTLAYGPVPNGTALAHPPFEAKSIKLDQDKYLLPGAPDALVVTAYDAGTLSMTLKNVGGRGVKVERPPQRDDYLFDQPTRVNGTALVAWGLLPNFQAFWVLDAVQQNQLVPASHLLLILLYTCVQVAAFLSLAVLLFEKRDVG